MLRTEHISGFPYVDDESIVLWVWAGLLSPVQVPFSEDTLIVPGSSCLVLVDDSKAKVEKAVYFASRKTFDGYHRDSRLGEWLGERLPGRFILG